MILLLGAFFFCTYRVPRILSTTTRTLSQYRKHTTAHHSAISPHNQTSRQRVSTAVPRIAVPQDQQHSRKANTCRSVCDNPINRVGERQHMSYIYTAFRLLKRIKKSNLPGLHEHSWYEVQLTQPCCCDARKICFWFRSQ